MKLYTSPDNLVEMSSNIEVKEFRIKSTAKSFRILSDGLYSNKIKAVIRELSCNAYDSHVAASKIDIPFELHLPSALEPWFHIQDFGVGLTSEEVVNVYTTYFESTKTDSNDYVGALGLGSKSPFSYTDNFSITSIKNKVKSVYAAYINDIGIPSISMLSSEDTTECNGVKISFSVNNSSDYYKFKYETEITLSYFKVRPVVTGANAKILNPMYRENDLIPGVHLTCDNYKSVAVMGNIAYPISIPQEESSDIFSLLSCGLELHFNIGELDFQASREGLSYVPQTIEAIRAKLVELQNGLLAKLTIEANAITNEWERADFLATKVKNSRKLWYGAVKQYAIDNNFTLFDGIFTDFKLTETLLLEEFNLKISGIHVKINGAISTLSTKELVRFTPCFSTLFFVNDTKRGSINRVKNHCRKRPLLDKRIYILEPVDLKKEIDLTGFFKLIKNPPDKLLFKVSDCEAIIPVKREPNTKVSSSNIIRFSSNGCWKATDFELKFNDVDTHFYVPVSGFTPIKSDICDDINGTILDFKYSGLTNSTNYIYGVRKSELENIKSKKNWVNLIDYLAAELKNIDLVMHTNLLVDKLYSFNFTRFNKSLIGMINTTGLYYKVMTEINSNSRKPVYSFEGVIKLMNHFNIERPDIKQKLDYYYNLCNSVNAKYPMLKHLSNYGVDGEMYYTAIAEYINLIDKQGV